jgi:hypothetical protein
MHHLTGFDKGVARVLCYDLALWREDTGDLDKVVFFYTGLAEGEFKRL